MPFADLHVAIRKRTDTYVTHSNSESQTEKALIQAFNLRGFGPFFVAIPVEGFGIS